MNIFLKRYKELGHALIPESIELKKAIRVNTLKIPEKELVALLKRKNVQLKKIPFLDSSYWANADFALSSTSEYLHGYIYMQEAASQIPAQVLSPESGDAVLDMCSAPGSKTTQLAALMKNKGTLVALDSNMARISVLKNNLERCGVRNCLVYHKDAVYADDLQFKFDKVLLDAPCSGNFTTDPDWFDKRSLEGLNVMAKIQKALMSSAVKVLKPDGTMVYSTCSLEPEENEAIMEWAIENLSLELVDTGLSVGEKGVTLATALCRRFWPDTAGTQGFFIAKLRLKT